jgi:Ca-activated chloride channel family protein
MQSIIQPRHLVLISLLALAGVTMTACGSSAEKLNQEGNEAFAKQAYEEALAAYQSAQIEAPELAEPYYNASNSLYRQEKYAEALEQMQKALSYAQEEELAQSSHFNLGNTAFNTQEWESEVESYKQALLLNPDDPDAKYNLELALQQQDEQQEQEQQQEQSEDGESQENDQQQEQGQSQQGDDQQDQEQQQEQDQSQENDQQNEREDQQQDQEQSQDDSQQQEQKSQNGEGQSEQGQPQDQQSPPNQVPRPGQRMTEEQARQLLEAIARDSDTLQERLGQYYLVPMGPPVQDW